MDWRLNGRNAEQNYKIIIDKGAVRAREINTSSAYPGGAVAQASPPVFKMESGSVECAISQHTVQAGRADVWDGREIRSLINEREGNV